MRRLKMRKAGLNVLRYFFTGLGSILGCYLVGFLILLGSGEVEFVWRGLEKIGLSWNMFSLFMGLFLILTMGGWWIYELIKIEVKRWRE